MKNYKLIDHIDLVAMNIERCRACLESGILLFPHDLHSDDTNIEVLIHIALDYLEHIEEDCRVLSDTIMNVLQKSNK